MSRVGKAPIKLQAGVKLNIQNGVVKVEGPKGKLNYTLPEGVVVKQDKDVVTVSLDAEAAVSKRFLHGVARTQIHNMVTGAATGFTRELDIVGVGYRAATKGNTLSLTLGFSHPVDYELPAGITAKVEANTHIVLNGADKVLVGMVASKIRSFRPPEPYQGKGIRYKDEHIIRKAGKAAAGAAGGK
jgi:large subunit ribosomal protein L6